MNPSAPDPADTPPPETDAEPRRPMVPRERGLRIGHPPQAIPLHEESPAEEWLDESESNSEDSLLRSARHDLDPIFGYIMAMALSVGLTPIQANVRYVVLWAFLAAMGGMAVLIGSGIKLNVTDPGDLLWGVGLGLFTGGALIFADAHTLRTASDRLFGAAQGERALLDTWIFQTTVFVMPVAESLFFRGAMQRVHSIPVVALLASLWSMLMFFPHLNLGDAPVVGVVFGMALVLLNFLYSYVNFRHGLAASFFCQIGAGSLLLLVPRLLSL